MNTIKIFNEISVSLPEYTYIDSIAYEITVNSGNLRITLDKNGVLSISPNKKTKIDTDFISMVYNFLEEQLDNEINKNKTSWYYYNALNRE